MILKLKQIVEIKSGVLFRSAIGALEKGNTVVIQLKDVSLAGGLVSSGLAKIDFSLNDSVDLVKPGDVLFKAKTNHPVAAVIREDLGTAVATAHFFVLRITDRKVSPGYLAWLLNQKPAQAYFDKHGAGSRIMVVNKQALGELEVTVPALAVQKMIEKLHSLQMKEGSLLEQLKEKKRVLIERQLWRAVEESLKEATHG